MRRRLWAWGRVLGGAAILAVLVWRLGTGPFLHGLRTVDGWSLLAAVSITVVTTVCSAWRWSVVARGLGVGIGLGSAVAAYYRSQFLNLALPGGVLGDVHRAVSHGRDAGDVGRGVRAVVWERSAGQLVQVVLTLIVLLVLPSPVRASMPVVAVCVVAGVVVLVLLVWALPANGSSRWARTVRAARADVRDGVLARRAWPGVVAASIVTVAGYIATFVVAARTAGTQASLARMLPLAMLVLLAMTLPVNIGGWGPREGVAAWAFAAAGLGGDQGITTAVGYGVMVLVASLPGAVVLAAVGWRARRPRRTAARPAGARLAPARWPAVPIPEGAAHG